MQTCFQKWKSTVLWVVIRLFGPDGPMSFVKSLKDGYEKAVKYFNYGVLDVNNDGVLAVAIKNTLGKVVFMKTFTPVK